MFSFKDGNGQMKKMIHGPNKIEMEIVNSMHIFNARTILRHRLSLENHEEINRICQILTLGKPVPKTFDTDELDSIMEFCLANNININDIAVYSKIKKGKETFTSDLYTQQKKRNNSYIYWNGFLLGRILCFLFIKGSIFSLIRQFTAYFNAESNIINRNCKVDLSKYKIPVRGTFCIYLIPAETIQGKMIRVKNYLCFPTNVYEKK